MSVQVGRWGVSIAVAIGAAVAWLLDWPPAASAALGALLVPLVAVAGGGEGSDRETSARAQPPRRGLCECGHPMSMHCGSDGAGACAASECRCTGHDHAASTQ
jgi:hypothetical protein